MNYFPVFIKSSTLKVLIIGGGEVAARKIDLLLKSTQDIKIVSLSLCESVQQLVETHQLVWLRQEYKQGLMTEHNLIIAATNNMQVNQAVYTEATQLEKLVNVVDHPELCTYITPAIIDRSPMIVAISSSASSPVLVRMLREQIDKLLPSDYGLLAEFAFKFRDKVKETIKGVNNRRLFWENCLRGNVGNSVLKNELPIAEQQLLTNLAKPNEQLKGEITFIHTKSGNPEHLTLQAHRALQFAEAVFYDSQVNLALLEYVRRDANKYPQSVDSSLLLNYNHALELAEQGQKVIYLLAGFTPLKPNYALTLSTISKTTLVCGE